ncbi:AEC family transporter [Capillimicrobium parvum]|uniref:Transporter n=1 Tax=Capillimicrobium parvum TaxID=2884022 RepID=A0A9E6Y2T9_9ACTN|nr:AEC family transporter [Capillimicrobium parvum]UGS39257.1 hypothetical protein DSM104329_05690 [Capillimicrobium parvum]
MTFLVAAVIAVSLAAGLLAEPRLPHRGRPVARAIAWVQFYVTLPFITFFVMVRFEPTGGSGLGLLAGYVELAIVGLIAWAIGRCVLHLSGPSLGALIVVCFMGNTGLVGTPLAGAIFGSDAIEPAIAFDALVSGPMFYVASVSIGAAFGSAIAPSARARVRALARNPPLIAVICGLVAPDALAPDVLVDAAHVLVYALVPFAFFMVGLTLGGEAEEGVLRFPPALTAPVAVAIGLRLVVAPLLMLALAALVGGVPDAYLLQAATPAAVSSVVVAHAFGLDLKLTASAVAWTTMIVVVAGMIVPSVL